MPLSPQEQAELAQLEAEVGQASQQGLTPDEQAELEALEAEVGEGPVVTGIRSQAKSTLDQVLGVASDVGSTALSGLAAVGEALDPYTGAPSRKALGELQKGKGVVGAAKAFGQQFGEPADETVPTSRQIMETQYAKEGISPEQYNKSLSEGLPFLYSETGEGLPLKKGGIFDPTRIGASSMALDVVADPTMLIPGKAVAKLGKAADVLVPSKMLKGIAETKAFKATGAMLKDFRAADKRGRVNEIGRIALDKGIVQAGDNVENVFEKAAAISKQSGEAIGDIHKSVMSQIDSPEFLSSLNDVQKLKIAESKIIPTQIAESLKADLKAKFKGKPNGNATFQRLETMIDETLVGNDAMNIGDVNKLKGEIDDLINYSKSANELPLFQQGLADVRRALQSKIENQIEILDSVVGGDLVKQLKDNNKLYGASKQIETIAKDRISRDNANRLFSPSDYYTAGAGATVGGVLGGPIGAAKGLALGGVNKVLRERGPSASAALANKLSKARPGEKITPKLINAAKAARGAAIVDREKQQREKALKGE